MNKMTKNLKCCKCGELLTDRRGDILKDFYSVSVHYNKADDNSSKSVLELNFCEGCHSSVAIKYVPDYLDLED